jgi:hypothetical protein
MDIHIRIIEADWNCLFDRVPADSPLRHLFRPTRSIKYGEGVVTIDCSRVEAERLLEIARHRCRGAVWAIQNAISESRRQS